MIFIHHDSAGMGQWTSEEVADLELAEDRAIYLCASAMVQSNRDLTVLIEVERGMVDRAMLTFGDNPDDEPYIGYRGCEARPLQEAMKLATTGDIHFSEPLGNFLP